MIVSAIVATARNRAIGKNNTLPWRLPADLAYFKRTTIDHHVLMGRRTFESLGKPLPGRTNVVITRDPDFSAEGVWVAHSIEEALGIAFDNGETEAFILGGAQIFEETLDMWDRLYQTEIDLEVPDADAFFPAINPSEWIQTKNDAFGPDAKNPHAYAFIVWERAPDKEEEMQENQ